MFGGVKLGVALLHPLGPVVLVHLWKVVSVVSQGGTNIVPPYREVFFNSAPKIRSMRSRLRHDFMEDLIASVPVLRLLMEEKHQCHRHRSAEIPASISKRFDSWSHKVVGQSDSKNRVMNNLECEVLHLMLKKLFHFDNLVLSQVVVLQGL